MTAALKNKRIFVCLALCALFFAASFAGSLHSAEHDATASASNFCSVCLSAGQLDSALVADVDVLVFAQASPAYGKPRIKAFSKAATPASRQRGPPVALST